MFKHNSDLFIVEQYLDLIDQNVIVSKTDSDGIITFVNEKFVNISGYSE